MATEYALLSGKEIANVVTCNSRSDAEVIAARMDGPLTVVPLDSLPIDVKRRYRFWNERP